MPLPNLQATFASPLYVLSPGLIIVTLMYPRVVSSRPPLPSRQAPAPAPFIKEMNDAGLFWGNRVIKENKAHQAFTRAWSEALKALQAYVKQHHTTGLSWNLRGADAAAVAGGDAASKGT